MSNTERPRTPDFPTYPLGTTLKSGKPRIIIVGGGFCGTALAINLLRVVKRPLQVVLLEPRSLPGRGVAYSTRDPRHLLNVPAENMSALADKPEHFVRWLVRHAGVFGPLIEAEGGGFAPRYVYGQYLQDTLETAAKHAHPGVTFAAVQAEALRLEPELQGVRLELSNQQTLSADAAVLALGNLPPRALPGIPPELVESGSYQPDPWRGAALGKLEPNDDVLIIGTGLTMVDLVVSLHGRGHRGHIYALSRRGLFPRTHLLHGAPNHRHEVALPKMLEASRPNSLSDLLWSFRASLKTHPGPWQEVVDSLREITPTLWQDLSRTDQQRFLRRIRPYWDIHRSRIAPQIASTLASCQSSGQLEQLIGHLHTLKAAEAGAEVAVREQGGTHRTLRVARVINATGPEGDLRRGSHPLLRSLLAAAHVQPDESGLGLAVGEGGRLRSQLPLYALGSLRRGESYEGIAVPELRMQALELAHTLNQQLVPGEQFAVSR